MHWCVRVEHKTKPVWCWGGNRWGQLGDNTGGVANAAGMTPTAVLWLNGPGGTALTHGATSISAGLEQVCAVIGGSSVWCWGDQNYGQLGNTLTSGVAVKTPVQVKFEGEPWEPLAGVQSVECGMFMCCAVSGGQVHCWGYNGNGQLGDGTVTQRTEPVIVEGLNDVVKVRMGGTGSGTPRYAPVCAITADGKLFAWGSGGYGQVCAGGGGAFVMHELGSFATTERPPSPPIEPSILTRLPRQH